MKQIYQGKLKLHLKKECPYYGTGHRTREKVLFYKFGWSLSLWTHHDSPLPEYSDWAKSYLSGIFPGCEFDGTRVIYNNKTYYPDDFRWIFNEKYSFEPTENWCVFFDKKSQKYIGYSHRAAQFFGVGDMLFDAGGKEDISLYYQNKKYRRKYLFTLLKYHLKNDWFGFQDLCEDNIIGHGIKAIVPFKERGRKQIENLEEAYQAACNFAHHVS